MHWPVSVEGEVGIYGPSRLPRGILANQAPGADFKRFLDLERVRIVGRFLPGTWLASCEVSTWDV